MTLAILFHRLGPYHHARLRAVADQAAFTAVEFSRVDDTYAWDIVDGEQPYPVISLFTDADIETKPVEEIESRIRAVLDGLRPRVLAIPGWSCRASLCALAWCLDTGTPAILMSASTAHDEHRTWWKEWIKTRVVGLFSAAVVGGAPHANYAVTLGLPRARVFPGYDVVDNDYFSASATKVRTEAVALRQKYALPQRYFLSSNRFIEKKNLPRLLAAYASYLSRAGEAAWDLVLLGDGPLKSVLIEESARLGLAKRVHFAGFRQYAELPVFYGLASAYIQASTSEQWGLVVNEAMASGLPVLVSDRCGCAHDLVRDGVNGFKFDPLDVETLAGHMFHMSHGNLDLQRMADASLEIVRNWSPATFAANLLKAADAALAAPRPSLSWLNRILLWALKRR